MRAPVTIAARLIISIVLVPLVAHAGLSVRPAVTIFAPDAFAHEDPAAPLSGAPAATRNAAFVVSRNWISAKSLTVFYAIQGTASSTGDYHTLRGAVTIPAGRRSARIIVNPIDDPRAEADPKTVVLRLKPARSYTLGQHIKATAFIADDYHKDDRTGFIGPPFPCPSCPAGSMSNQWWQVMSGNTW